MINPNVKRNPNPNHNPNLNPYPTPNPNPNHYPHSNSCQRYHHRSNCRWSKCRITEMNVTNSSNEFMTLSTRPTSMQECLRANLARAAICCDITLATLMISFFSSSHRSVSCCRARAAAWGWGREVRVGWEKTSCEYLYYIRLYYMSLMRYSGTLL